MCMRSTRVLRKSEKNVLGVLCCSSLNRSAEIKEYIRSLEFFGISCGKEALLTFIP